MPIDLDLVALHEKVFLIVYHLLGPASFISPVTVFFAEWFPWVLGMFPFVYELYLRDGERLLPALRRIYLAPLLVYCVTMLIKFYYPTPRPFALLEIPPSFTVGSDPFGLASFPSSHTAFFAALAVTMYFCNHKVGKWFYIGAVAIGLARIGAGVHWPVDILGGFLIGATLGFVFEKTLELIWKNNAPQC
jgi:membrane-associated phospholipid phosphatase